MCKIAVVSGINKDNAASADTLITELSFVLSEVAGHKDGFGYAAITDKGEIFGERWVKNDDAFAIRTGNVSEGVIAKLKEYGDVLKPQGDVQTDVYNNFGTPPDKVEALSRATTVILHTRLATTAKGLKNTHPFYDPETNTALIHNGVISNAQALTMKTSTCDSETILNEYTSEMVYDDPNNIQKVADSLRGYYACAVLSKTTSGTPLLDIFKCDTSELAAGYVEELGIVVFCSKFELLKQACDAVGLTVVAPQKVKDNTLIRINPLTGEFLTSVSFKSAPRYDYGGSGGYNSRYGYAGWYDHDDYEVGAKANKKKQNKSKWSKDKLEKVADKILQMENKGAIEYKTLPDGTIVRVGDTE